MSYSFKNMFYTIGEHFRHYSSIYILILCIAGFIGGLAYYINYKIDEDSKYDMYQICPKYSGNRCTLLPTADWEEETVFGVGSTCRFYNKHDPSQIKVFQYSTTKKIISQNYVK
jgi:hypothetical protein